MNYTKPYKLKKKRTKKTLGQLTPPGHAAKEILALLTFVVCIFFSESLLNY